MIAILKREINSFFSSIMGYLVIGVFLLITGLFLWIFKGGYNIFDAGFADLNLLFELAPWILLFLIPAVTMRSLSDEIKMGTFELLATKPISLRSIVLGKYFGAVILILIALLPTSFYTLTITELASNAQAVDKGGIIGSYLGLSFLVFAYTAVGLFSSSLTNNQIVSFILAVLLSFLLYFGFEGLSRLFDGNTALNYFGMKAHFNSMTRGIIDTRDIIYFLSITIFFIAFTILRLQRRS